MSDPSQKQIEANRRNAVLGGVKTPEGKAISKYNALQHGLLSKQILMDGEDKKLLLELEKRLRNELEPATEMELLLVDRIAANTWRLKRALGFERYEVLSNYGEKLGLHGNADLFFRYETMLERSIYKALHELQRVQAARAGEKTPLPIAIDVDVAKEL